MTAGPEQIAAQRAIRVFVSSTFRDMRAEREELVKRVFPQLRKLCEARHVTWGEVDLRWGITEDQSQRGEVLPLCLAEIERCRPYFICMLGERYGWIPTEMPTDVLAQYPWIAEHTQHSVTALEILHGVLRSPGMACQAMFYFRDPAYIGSLPHSERGDYLELGTIEEIDLLGAVEAERRAATRRQALAALKARIRADGFPVREGYQTAQSFGALVLADLTAIIDRAFPAGSELDPQQREAADHEAFALSRARVYIARAADHARLDEHANGSGPPLLVLGPSGSGKSSLLANWVLQYRNRLSSSALRANASIWSRVKRTLWPSTQRPPLVLMHFVGVTPASTNWVALVQRIISAINQHFDLNVEIPDEPSALRQALARALTLGAARGRMVLVIDGLNQLEDHEGALDLGWLPAEVPDDVRLVLATLPGRSLDRIAERGWPTMHVALLAPPERKELIERNLAQHAKQLSVARAERIAATEQAASPLYLRTLLDELRIFGSHEGLDVHITHYLAAPNPIDLFARILQRYEQDYERERPELVRDAFSLLWASRHGLSEAELLDMLGTEAERSLPHAYWSPLFLAAEPSLVNRSGLIGFHHDYMRQAVERRYLASETSRQGAHRRLADYFRGRESGPRKLQELPWQLSQAGDWNALATLLADLEYLQLAWKASPSDVRACWALAEANSTHRAIRAYAAVRSAPAQYADYVWTVASLLQAMGHASVAFELQHFLSKKDLSEDNVGRLQASLGNQAVSLIDINELDAAERLLKDQEKICRARGLQHGLQACLNNQGLIWFRRGERDRALKLFKESERINRKTGDRGGLQSSLGNQATVLTALNELKPALELLLEQQRLCLELGDKHGLAVCLGNQAEIRRKYADYETALKLFEEQEALWGELGDKNGRQIALGNQASILIRGNDLDRALALYEEKERLARELGNMEGVASGLAGQALVLVQSRRDLKRALSLAHQAEAMASAHGLVKRLQEFHLVVDHIRSQVG